MKRLLLLTLLSLGLVQAQPAERSRRATRRLEVADIEAGELAQPQARRIEQLGNCPIAYRLKAVCPGGVDQSYRLIRGERCRKPQHEGPIGPGRGGFFSAEITGRSGTVREG